MALTSYVERKYLRLSSASAPIVLETRFFVQGEHDRAWLQRILPVSGPAWQHV